MSIIHVLQQLRSDGFQYLELLAKMADEVSIGRSLETPLFPSKGFRKQPTQARAVERVRRILLASEELLDQGKKLSSAVVAKSASVPIGTFYQFFRDVDHVLLAVLDQRLGEAYNDLLAQIEHLDPEADSHEVIELLVSSYARYFQRHARIWAIQRALHFSTEMLEAIGDQRTHLATEVAERLLVHRGLNRTKAIAVGRVLIEATVALSTLALITRDKALSKRIVSEQKVLLRTYLAHYLG